MNDPFRNFDRDFAAAQRSVGRTAGAIIVIAVLWMSFLAASIGTVIWAGGRYLGVW